MKPRFFNLLAVIFTCLGLFIAGCKEDTILGSSVISVGDTANTISIPDTLTILTKTAISGKLKTSVSISGIPIYHALGTVSTDPIAGKTTAGFYFQVVPPSLGYSFPKTPDSAILILPFSGFAWGDTTLSNLEQELLVYEIANNDSIRVDSSYYANSFTAYNATSIGSARIGFNANANHQRIKDSVSVRGKMQNAHVRIKLSQDFVNRFITEAAKTSGSAMGAYSDFLNFQRGFYITTSDTNNGNALYYFLLNGGSDFTRANIQFFYTDASSGTGDSVKYASFYFDQTKDAHYNRFTRNFSGKLAGNLITSPTTSDSIVVVQNEPGAALDILIPFAKKLPAKPIIKAELIITQYKMPGDQSDIYYPPSRLYPVRVQGDTVVSIQDRYPLTSSEPLIFMDGLRRDYVNNGVTYSQYVLNIPRELQRAVIDQRDTLHLRLNGAVTFPGAYRLLAGGRSLSDNNLKIKLKIYYAKL
ncbi:MAG: hypothetical protein JSS64_01590 [Bacteroidetes bacterium]|nr:hypothetical protein [Bacteroidota bacterium]